MLFGRLVLLVKVGWSQVKRWEVMESDLFWLCSVRNQLRSYCARGEHWYLRREGEQTSQIIYTGNHDPASANQAVGPQTNLTFPSMFMTDSSLLANTQCMKAADSLCTCPDVTVLIVHIFMSGGSRVPKSTSVTLSVGMHFHLINMKKIIYTRKSLVDDPVGCAF